MPQFKRLFQPIKIGSLELKNRVVMLGVNTKFDIDGVYNDRIRNYYLRRAKGGVGLVIFGAVYPFKLQGPIQNGVSFYKDEHIPSLKNLVDEIHSEGAKVSSQLTVRYAWRKSEDEPLELVAPSTYTEKVAGFLIPHEPGRRELTIEEIEQIVNQYGDAARRSREAGFDSVEVLAAMGYLPHRFISPYTNKRTDKYGGTLTNRLRFVTEIIENIKQKAGHDYPLSCRFSAVDLLPGGHSLEEGKQVAQILERAGIHCLNVYVGASGSTEPMTQSSVPQGAFVYCAEEIKKVVKVPVVATVRIKDPVMAEQILVQGKADLIGMTRALIADPDWCNKVKEGKLDEIRPCITCVRCLTKITHNEPMECSVNPWAGREAEELKVKPVAKPKKVFIVGGGPAGMEDAIMAAKRGHRVSLFERNARLGGQLLVASVAPYKETEPFMNYLIGQVKKAGVNVVLNTKVTSQFVIEGKPDVVIIATGAGPNIPDVPGVQGGNVITAIDVLSGGVDLGNKVIVLGSRLIACEVAEYLAAKGKKVTIVSEEKRLGNDIEAANRWVVMKRLIKAGIIVEPGSSIEEIKENSVSFKQDGQSRFLKGDSIVIAVGMKSNKELIHQLEGKVTSLFSLGDCVEPSTIRQAIHNGSDLGTKI